MNQVQLNELNYLKCAVSATGAADHSRLHSLYNRVSETVNKCVEQSMLPGELCERLEKGSSKSYFQWRNDVLEVVDQCLEISRSVRQP